MVNVMEKASPRARRLRLYQSKNGWLYAARSFDDVQRLAEDSDAHGGWTRLEKNMPVTLRTTQGGTIEMTAGDVCALDSLQRGLVLAPEAL